MEFLHGPGSDRCNLPRSRTVAPIGGSGRVEFLYGGAARLKCALVRTGVN